MYYETFEYQISEKIPIEEVKDCLIVAIHATESLHGEIGTHLTSCKTFDAVKRIFTVETSCPAGRDLNRLFAGFLKGLYGWDAYSVTRKLS
jgi:hypothetical protein